MRLRVLTYNIRKAKGGWRARGDDRALAAAIRERDADVVLCQEVFHSSRENGCDQTTTLRSALDFATAYGKNAAYSRGHHGNATFTRHRIVETRNFDLSTNPIERRGVLWTRVAVDGCPIDVFNTHLGLNRRQRRIQSDRIIGIVRDLSADGGPLLLAGDFNDWSAALDGRFRDALGVDSSLARLGSRESRSYPNVSPLLALDRIFWRGLEVRALEVLRTDPFHRLSDHLPIEAEFGPEHEPTDSAVG